MAKRKSKKVKDLSEENVHVGTPTLALLPARNYFFKVSKKEYKITVPRSGVYAKLAPDLYDKDEGEFMLLDEKNSVMYLPAISKVLFAVGKYPDLKSNQLFAPIAFVFKKKEVDIIGQIVDILEPPNISSTSK